MKEFALSADASAGLEKIIVCCARAANPIVANASITTILDGKKYICSLHARTMDNLRQKRIQNENRPPPIFHH